MEALNRTLDAQSGLSSWTSAWVRVGKAGYRCISWTTAWAAVAATSGTLSFEGTDDPTQTSVVALTPTVTHGTYPTVGTAAAAALVVLANCPGWVRMRYTRAAGGAAGQFTQSVTLTE